MAEPSEVKAGLQEIASIISNSRKMNDKGNALKLAARNQLAAIPGQFSDIVATVDGYTPTGAFETLSKDEKAKLQAEFVALRQSVESELTALGISF